VPLLIVHLVEARADDVLDRPAPAHRRPLHDLRGDAVLIFLFGNFRRL
jgi:hypothetical protein